MKALRIFGKSIYWLVIVTLIFTAGFLLLTIVNIPGNYKIQSVLSGSMEPAIKTGSIVVVKPQTKYFKNEVISFRDPMDLKTTVTHRINDLSLKEGSFITKGDANEERDTSEVASGNVLGKVIFTVPFAGYFAEFMKGKNGILVVLVIAALIIFNEVLNIKNESLRMIKKRGKENVGLEDGINQKLL